nr:hypothetical protein [Tanacetum cinerariifolium]
MGSDTNVGNDSQVSNEANCSPLCVYSLPWLVYMFTAPIPNDAATCPKDIPHSKPVSFASILSSEQVHKKAAMESVKNKYVNSLVGYFVGKSLAFSVVQNHVNNTWGKFRLQKVMRNDDVVFMFKYASEEGLEQVFKRGPWMIRKLPIILTKWSSRLSLKKGDVTSVPVWVKLHGMPILVYSEDGLSLIATQIEWKPSHCGDCKSFGHDLLQCPKHVKETVINDPPKVGDECGVFNSMGTSNKHTPSKWNEDFESDDEVDEVIFLKGNKWDDQFDIQLKGRVRK